MGQLRHPWWTSVNSPPRTNGHDFIMRFIPIFWICILTSISPGRTHIPPHGARIPISRSSRQRPPFGAAAPPNKVFDARIAVSSFIIDRAIDFLLTVFYGISSKRVAMIGGWLRPLNSALLNPNIAT